MENQAHEDSLLPISSQVDQPTSLPAFPMSDSESSTSLPSESRIEATLRKVVSTGNLEELTLKRVRKAAEQELGLPEDFFKTSLEWKDRSKTIVTAEVVGQ